MKKEKPLCPPEKRPKYEDIVFAVVPAADGSSMELKLDIYQAPDQQEPGPCIIYYFGGGWMWGEYKPVTQKAVYCRDIVFFPALLFHPLSVYQNDSLLYHATD